MLKIYLIHNKIKCKRALYITNFLCAKYTEHCIFSFSYSLFSKNIIYLIHIYQNINKYFTPPYVCFSLYNKDSIQYEKIKQQYFITFLIFTTQKVKPYDSILNLLSFLFARYKQVKVLQCLTLKPRKRVLNRGWGSDFQCNYVVVANTQIFFRISTSCIYINLVFFH